MILLLSFYWVVYNTLLLKLLETKIRNLESTIKRKEKKKRNQIDIDDLLYAVHDGSLKRVDNRNPPCGQEVTMDVDAITKPFLEQGARAKKGKKPVA